MTNLFDNISIRMKFNKRFHYITLIYFIFSACAAAVDVGTTSSSASDDTTAPSSVTTSIQNDATGIAINTASLSITSDEELSETESSMSLTSSSQTIALGTCSTDDDTGKILTCPISETLPTSTKLTWSTKLVDTATTKNEKTITVEFTTSDSSDTTTPTLSSPTPDDGATGVSTSLSSLKLVSNEALDSTTCSTSSVTSSPAISLSACTYTESNFNCSCTVSASLAASTKYTVTFALKDRAGNSASKTYSFTTGTSADTTAPTVTSFDPSNGTSNVSICQPIFICLSETINSAQCTTTNGTFTPAASPASATTFGYCCVTGGASCSTKSSTCSGTEFEFGLSWAPACRAVQTASTGLNSGTTGNQSWNINTTYTITIKNIQDPSGNTMADTSVQWTTQP